MRATRERLRRDDGLGLTEVAIAIVVLGIVLVGILPLVVDSIRLAARNAEVAQANRIVATQLDAARVGVGVACTGADTPASAGPVAITLTGDDATRFTATRTVSCDAANLARVTVSVARSSDPGSAVATATTKVVTA